MHKSTFRVGKMDCPNEEQLIRFKLNSIHGVSKIEVDLPAKLLSVYHEAIPAKIVETLEDLQLDSKLLRTEESTFTKTNSKSNQKKVLTWVLIINFAFFFIEAVAGFFAHSMGLVADSLDMLADAIVYGLSLYVVDRSLRTKKNVTKIMGIFQFSLALFGLIEVVKRFLGIETVPTFQTMIVVSFLALIANLASLFLLQRSKSQEVHMKASWIFTTNDVLANIGVILAGLLVNYTNSPYPDLLIGSLIFLMVARGAYKILQLSR